MSDVQWFFRIQTYRSSRGTTNQLYIYISPEDMPSTRYARFRTTGPRLTLHISSLRTQRGTSLPRRGSGPTHCAPVSSRSNANKAR
jgi:hypothetical protein